MAECCYQMGEYRRSIGITRDCLKIARKKTPEAYESFTIYGLNLSEYHEAIGEHEEASAILDSVAEDAARLEPGSTLSAYTARRTVTAYISGDLERAEEYADALLDAVGKGFGSYEIHPDFEKIIKAELKIGDLTRAKLFADRLTEYAKTSGRTIDEIIASRVMAEYSLAAGEKERALELYVRLSELYRKRMKEEKAIQFDVQRNVEQTNREIGKLLKKVKLSEEIAEKDPLTGLLNRSALVKTATEFVEKAQDKGSALGGHFHRHRLFQAV